MGRTNAGKSTLVNALVGEKVSIVSPVEQTTRNTIRGIVSDERGQLVLLDTPGLHKAVGELGRILNRMARRSAAGTDIVCVVFDAAQEPQLEDIGWMQRIAKERPERVVFVLNKADKAPFFETMFRDAWKEASDEARTGDERQKTRMETSDVRQETSRLASPVSGPVSSVSSPSLPVPVWVKAIASTPGGAKAVADALFEMAEEGERLFDDDIVTDYPRKLAIADSVREKFLAKLHQELPHELGVYVKSIREKPPRKSGAQTLEHPTPDLPVWEIEVDLLVNRASQKPIVIGKGAQTIKYVRKCAEREVGEMFGVKAEMSLWVNVEPNWMKNKRLLTDMGYYGELV